MKAAKRIILLVLLIIALTHRHEDYCTDPSIHFQGTKETPYTFGPFHKRDIAEDSSLRADTVRQFTKEEIVQ